MRPGALAGAGTPTLQIDGENSLADIQSAANRVVASEALSGTGASG